MPDTLLKSSAIGASGANGVANHDATQTALAEKANAADLGTAALLDVPATGDAAADEVVKGDDSRLTDSRAPTGGAGGVLSGTYPNPGFAVDMVEQSEFDTALALKAPLASPAFTGNPTAPTQAPGNNSTRLSTTAYVDAAIAALIDGAPGAIDTLNELAAALGDDPDFATTVTNALAGKLAAASNLSDVADAAAARANLGVEIGTDVQAFHANLAALAGLTLIADRLPYANGSGTLALATLTAFARTLLDDADAGTARGTLGLGTAATSNTGDFATAAQGATADAAVPKASGIGVVEHGATAGTARPSGYAAVHWYGTVEPTNAANNDLWFDTTP